MTVGVTNRVAQYTGNAATTAFAVPFQFFEIVVYSDGVEVDDSDYVISQSAPGLTGTVTFNTAPASGKVITIASDTSVVQSTDYVDNDDFPAETHERALDRLTMAVQDTQRDTSTQRGAQHIADAGKLSTYNDTGQLDAFEPGTEGYVYLDADGVAQIEDTAPGVAAAASAAAAATSATAAATSATAAASSASAASTSASAASTSASAASTSASSASTSASNASTSASAASTSATNAASSASSASTSASAASTSATSASTSATNAASSATAAAASAAAAASVAASMTGTSTTSVAVGTGSKTFTTQSGKQWAAGQFVLIASAANPDKYMLGQVTSYTSTTLVVNVTAIGNTGTLADWNISVSGVQGPTGPSGETTTTDPIGVSVYRDSGSNVALGGYPATRRVSANRTCTHAFAEVVNGTGTVEVAVTRAGVVLANGTASYGSPWDATVSLSLSAGDAITFEILNVTGTVTGVFAQID